MTLSTRSGANHSYVNYSWPSLFYNLQSLETPKVRKLSRERPKPWQMSIISCQCQCTNVNYVAITNANAKTTPWEPQTCVYGNINVKRIVHVVIYFPFRNLSSLLPTAIKVSRTFLLHNRVKCFIAKSKVIPQNLKNRDKDYIAESQYCL